MERPPQRLIVVAGLPGTGKSSIAEAIGESLGVPVFAKDWLEAALLRSGVDRTLASPQVIGYAGYELLTTLAERQLRLGQSAILDSVASTKTIRDAWRTLASRCSARWRVVECICSDQTLHRGRLGSRIRGIPGWQELEWEEVERVQSYYAPWQEDRLILDAVEPLNTNVDLALRYALGA